MAAPDVQMQRHSASTPDIALTDSLSTTTAIRLDLHANIGFIVTDLNTGVKVTCYVSGDGTNFYELNDPSDTAIEHDLTVNHAYTIPDECKPFPWVKLVLDAGTATITVCRKS